MPLTEDYQVRLEAFCGPLDLLLYLIRQAEVDIHEISVSTITDQYLEFLHEAPDVDVDAAGEFLVMAATLIELKSRTLVPPEAAAGEGSPGRVASDPRFELVQQLLEYQRFRVASESLSQRREALRRRYANRPCHPHGPRIEAPPELDLEDAHVFDLYEAYERIIAAIDFDRLGDHRVEIDDTPAAFYQQRLLERLHATPDRRLTLPDLFEGQRWVQRIGFFLAMLELARLRRVAVQQEDLASEILIQLEEEDFEPQRRAEEP